MSEFSTVDLTCAGRTEQELGSDRVAPDDL